MYGPVRERGTRAESLLSHAACFLEAHEVALTRPLADFVLRPISIGLSGTARGIALRLRSRQSPGLLRAQPNAGFARSASLRNTAVCSTASPTRSTRPGREARAWCRLRGSPDSGNLRTFRLLAARMARLQGYVPVAPDVLRTYPWVADHLLARHVCVIGGETCGTATGRSDRVGAHATQRRKPSSSCRPVIRPPAGSRGRGPLTGWIRWELLQ